MGLFGFGKKKEEEKGCCCGSNRVEDAKTSNDTASYGASCCCCKGPKDTDKLSKDNGKGICSIKVLGAGCRSCHELFENTKKVVEELGLEIEVEYITDMEKIMSYGAMSMPVLVVDEKVVSVGKVLKPSEISKLLG